MSQRPYPGLRAFWRDEIDIFFGRERQIDEILEKLQNSHFLAVLGPSGCGKSSLMRISFRKLMRRSLLGRMLNFMHGI